MSLTGRVALVTGATSGIGQATARLLATSGARVVATGRHQERLDQLVAAVSDSGGAIVGVAGDVTRPEVVGSLLETARSEFGAAADAVVLCAGLGLPGTLLGSDPERWEELVEVNYLAMLRQLRACAETLVAEAERDGGSIARDIAVIGSTIGRQVSPFNPVYGSTKFALHSVVEALRQEVCGHGIRTTLIEPGFVKSGFQDAAGYSREWFDSVERDMGPLLEPDDVARVVGFVMAQPPHVHVDDVRIRPTRQKA